MDYRVGDAVVPINVEKIMEEINQFALYLPNVINRNEAKELTDTYCKNGYFIITEVVELPDETKIFLNNTRYYVYPDEIYKVQIHKNNIFKFNINKK